MGHFVGDIHQPMHVGYPEDLGGNRHFLTFKNGKKTNMHKLWDGQIIEHMEIVHGKDYLQDRVGQKIGIFFEARSTLTRSNLGLKKAETLRCRNLLVIAIMS